MSTTSRPSLDLLRRHLIPLGLAFIGSTVLILGRLMVKQVPRLQQLGAPPERITEVFVLSLPFIIAMTVPMAVLIAVLWVFTRLGRNGDAIAIPAKGIEALRLMMPVLAAAVCVAVLLLLWTDRVLPRSNHRLRALLIAVQRDDVPSTAGVEYKSDREMTLAELREAAAAARLTPGPIELASRRRWGAYEVEIQKKYALAAACVVFALFGASAGLRLPRGRRWPVVGVSVVVFAVYYVGLVGGELLGDDLTVSPFLAMWTPNLILFALGVATLWRGGEGESHSGHIQHPIPHPTGR